MCNDEIASPTTTVLPNINQLKKCISTANRLIENVALIPNQAMASSNQFDASHNRNTHQNASCIAFNDVIDHW